MKIIHPDSPLFKDVVQTELASFSEISLFDGSLMDPAVKCPAKSIVAADNFEPVEVVAKLIGSGANSVLQKNKKNFAADLKIAGEYQQNPGNYFNQPNLNLNGAGVITTEVAFSTSLDKPNIKRELNNILTHVQNQNVIESSEAVVEELYMNAMLDAPREAAKLGQVNCTYDVGLHATIRMALSSDRLVISCEDPFGSLDAKKFIRRMNEVYVRGAGESINFREGGAGLGCVIIFEHCEALYLGVIPGQTTLVTVVIPVGLSYRQRAQIKKSLHLVLK